MLNKNSPGLLKKGAAKQSRIKSIAWHITYFCINQSPTAEIFIIYVGRNAHKDGPQTEKETYTEATHGLSSEVITCIV